MPAAAYGPNLLCLDSVSHLLNHLSGGALNSCTEEVFVEEVFEGGEMVTRVLFPRRFSQLVREFKLGFCKLH